MKSHGICACNTCTRVPAISWRNPSPPPLHLSVHSGAATRRPVGEEVAMIEEARLVVNIGNK